MRLLLQVAALSLVCLPMGIFFLSLVITGKADDVWIGLPLFLVAIGFIYLGLPIWFVWWMKQG